MFHETDPNMTKEMIEKQSNLLLTLFACQTNMTATLSMRIALIKKGLSFDVVLNVLNANNAYGII